MVNYGGSDPMTARLGLAAQSMQPETINNSNLGIASGVCAFQLVRPISTSITRLSLQLGTAGGTVTGFCGMGVWSEAGVLLASTADMSAALTSAGNNGKIVEGLIAGGLNWSTSANYYLGFLSQLTSQPTIGGQDVTGVQLPAFNTHITNAVLTGQTALPASFTPASAGTSAAAFYFGAR